MSFLSYRTRMAQHLKPRQRKPRPNGVASLPGSGHTTPFPRRSVGYADGIELRRWPIDRLGYRSPCPGRGFCGRSFVGSGRSTTIASIVSRSSLQSGTLWLLRSPLPAGPPSASTRIDFLVPFFAAIRGILAHLFFPQTGPCPTSRRRPAIPTGPRPSSWHFSTSSLRSPSSRRLHSSVGTSRGRCSWGRTFEEATGTTGSGTHPEDHSVEPSASWHDVARGLAWPESVGDRLDPLHKSSGISRSSGAV